MRHDIDEMLHEVTLRSEKTRRKMEQRTMRIMSFMSCVLVLSLVGAVSVLSLHTGGESAPSVYGSTLITEDSGGYVIVAVIAFVLGVVFTHTIQKYRRKS